MCLYDAGSRRWIKVVKFFLIKALFCQVHLEYFNKIGLFLDIFYIFTFLFKKFATKGYFSLSLHYPFKERVLKYNVR